MAAKRLLASAFLIALYSTLFEIIQKLHNRTELQKLRKNPQNRWMHLQILVISYNVYYLTHLTQNILKISEENPVQTFKPSARFCNIYEQAQTVLNVLSSGYYRRE